METLLNSSAAPAREISQRAISQERQRSQERAARRRHGSVGTSSLLDAASKGDVENLKEYILAGDDVNKPDFWGRSALMLASRAGHFDAVLFLLEHGANINARGPWGGTAYSHATQQGHTSVSELLQAWSSADDPEQAMDNALEVMERHWTTNLEQVISVLEDARDEDLLTIDLRKLRVAVRVAEAMVADVAPDVPKVEEARLTARTSAVIQRVSTVDGDPCAAVPLELLQMARERLSEAAQAQVTQQMLLPLTEAAPLSSLEVDVVRLEKAIANCQAAGVADSMLDTASANLLEAKEKQRLVTEGKGCYFWFVLADRLRGDEGRALRELPSLQGEAVHEPDTPSPMSPPSSPGGRLSNALRTHARLPPAELRRTRPEWLELRFIRFDAACRGEYHDEYLAVSHRWDTKQRPDPSGEQLSKIRNFLTAKPSFKYVFYDYSSMSQGRRTAAQLREFKLMLPNINLLYLGSSVLILMDRSCEWSRPKLHPPIGCVSVLSLFRVRP